MEISSTPERLRGVFGGLASKMRSSGPDGFLQYLNTEVSDAQVRAHLRDASGGRDPFIQGVDMRLLHVHEKAEIIAMKMGLSREDAHTVAKDIENMFRKRIHGPSAGKAKPLPGAKEKPASSADSEEDPNVCGTTR